MKNTIGITKEVQKEVLKALRLLAFGILEELKRTKKGNFKYGAWRASHDSCAAKRLNIEIEIWKDALKRTPKELIKYAGKERARQQYYCQHHFGFKSQIEEINKLISQEYDEINKEVKKFYSIPVKGIAQDIEDYFFTRFGYWISSEFEKNDTQARSYIERAREIAKDYITCFEEWDSKRSKTRKTSKRVKEVKNVVNNADASTGISIKSFCCSVMGAIRDYMVKSGIEDYKGATCELGQKRKEAVRSLICYSKTQDSQKVQNFKDQVKGSPYSSKFSNWPELAETIKGLEASFIG